MVYSQNGDFLGETEIMYIDIVEQVLKQAEEYPNIMRKFLKAAFPCLNENSVRSSCDTPNPPNVGRLTVQQSSYVSSPFILNRTEFNLFFWYC